MKKMKYKDNFCKFNQKLLQQKNNKGKAKTTQWKKQNILLLKNLFLLKRKNNQQIKKVNYN